MKDMNTKEMKDMVQYKLWKMRGKRNILFRAFLINYIAVFVVWLISLTPLYTGLMHHFAANQTAAGIEMYMLNIFGMWKILGVILFLMPALAIWWEMCFIKKEHDM
ncbi:MAG: hypothetical protein FWG39_01520 [Alphaproteobacteria bacterium]|nr:hypothetical protein [Alphaproteobacteria bacterium]